MKTFYRDIGFWVISVQALAALFATIHRFPVSDGWENVFPEWRRINSAVSVLNPEDVRPEKFLGPGTPGFNELLDLIDKKFVGLPNKAAIRGITNRRDEFVSKSGQTILKTIDTWIDFGDMQYLRVASRNVLLEKVKEKRATLFFTIALWLLIFGLILRYIEYFKKISSG